MVIHCSRSDSSLLSSIVQCSYVFDLMEDSTPTAPLAKGGQDEVLLRAAFLGRRSSMVGQIVCGLRKGVDADWDYNA